MELQVWLAYFLASWAIALSPGSGAVLSMTHGLAYGVQKTGATIAGLQLGLAVILLVAGGLAYTVGVVFFMLDSRVRYAHAVWHGFVAAGTGLHFFAVLGYAA